LSPLASCNAATNADLKRSALRSSMFLGCFRVCQSVSKQWLIWTWTLNSYYTIYKVQGRNLQNVNVKSDKENDSCYYHLNPRIRTIHLYNCISENAGLPPLWPFTAGVNADAMWAWVVLAFASVEHRAASTEQNKCIWPWGLAVGKCRSLLGNNALSDGGVVVCLPWSDQMAAWLTLAIVWTIFLVLV
jgi:hypothetical protein